MFLVALIVGFSSGSSGGRTLTPALSLGERGPEVWRFGGEARALVEFEGAPVAATAAGVFVRRNGAWTALGTDAPVGLVSLVNEDGTLVGTDAAQRAFRLKGGRWETSEARAAGLRTLPALDAPPPGSSGAFLSASTPSVRSYWGDTHLWRGDERWIQRPPSAGDYALLDFGGTLYAGTPDGVFGFDGTAWKREGLPGDLPLARPHGLAFAGVRWVIGGLQGLWMGAPGKWEEVGRQPVRQILGDGSAVWVLYGSGALDKLEPARNRRYSDVLHGAAKRPWASCLGWSSDRTLLIGGDGGWVEKQGAKFVERYPEELKGQVVTAIAGYRATRYVGTQKGGLFRFSGSRVSVFNPGNGLRDPWVTALRVHAQTRPWREPAVSIATAGGGLFSLASGMIHVPSPSEALPSSRPRAIGRFGDRVVVGAMDGAWEWVSGKWQALPIQGEEVTALAEVEGGLALVTAAGVWFFRR